MSLTGPSETNATSREPARMTNAASHGAGAANAAGVRRVRSVLHERHQRGPGRQALPDRVEPNRGASHFRARLDTSFSEGGLRFLLLPARFVEQVASHRFLETSDREIGEPLAGQGHRLLDFRPAATTRRGRAGPCRQFVQHQAA